MKRGLLAAAQALMAAACLADPELLRNPAFESGTSGWTLPGSKWRADGSSGRRGSGALSWESPVTGRVCYATQYFPVEGGGVYRFGSWVKNFGVDGTPGGASMQAEAPSFVAFEAFDANNGYLRFCKAAEVVDNVPGKDGWKNYEGSTGPLPSSAVRGRILLGIEKWSAGKVLFDDVMLKCEGARPVGDMVSSRYRDEGGDGEVTFHVALAVNEIKHPLSTLSAEFSFPGADAKPRRLKAAEFDAGHAAVTLQLSEMAAGKVTVAFTLRAASRVLGTSSLVFDHSSVPARRVSFDRHNRAFVDGMPFFPLGMYVLGRGLDDFFFSRISEGPFNCALPYARPDRTAMDRARERGIMVFYNVIDHLQLTKWMVERHGSDSAVRAHLLKTVAEVKDHPALLGWYVNDECPQEKIPLLVEGRRLLHELDPDHPTYSVTDKPGHCRALASACDVIGMDPYPVGNDIGDIDICSRWTKAALAGTYGVRPSWQVPQAFNWHRYRPAVNHPDHRFPSAEELSNMTWQAIAAGANGLVYYSFTNIFRDQPPAEAERAWSDLLKVVRGVKDREPILLSEPGPAAPPLPEGVIARTWRTPSGEVWLLAVNTTRKTCGDFRPLETRFMPLKSVSSVYPDPAPGKGENGYRVKVDGSEAVVSDIRVSAYPFNRRWPGHQRGLDQTEIAGMVRYEAPSSAVIEVVAPRAFTNVVVRPLSRGIRPVVKGRSAVFEISEPGGYSVEFDDSHRALHVFAYRPETDRMTANAKNVRYFGPGVHDIGIVKLKSGDRVYLDRGAVVYGGFHASNATDIVISGRGILDGSRIRAKILFAASGDGSTAATNAVRRHLNRFDNCRNVRIDGLVIRDSPLYNIAMWGCEDISVNDIMIVGQWRYNTDGIDMHNCRRFRVSNCFARTFDDTFCFKAHEGYGNCEDGVFEHCVAWNDWGKALEVGVECRAEHLRNLRFVDCDIIHAVGPAMDVSNVDYGRVSDVLFDNIRLEADERLCDCQIQKSDAHVFDFGRALDRPPFLFLSLVDFHHEYSTENGGMFLDGGHVDGVTLRNVKVTSWGPKPLVFHRARNALHRQENVVFENLSVNGTYVSSTNGVELVLKNDALPPRFVVDDAVARNSTEMNRSAVSAGGGSEGGVKVLVVGNSIALHGINHAIGWTNLWGMAASAAERDFAHLVVRGIERKLGRKADFRIRNWYLLERDPAGYDAAATNAADVAWAPEYVIVALGENVPAFKDACDAEAWENALVKVGRAFKAANPAAKIVFRSTFWRNEEKNRGIAAAAKRLSATYADIGDLGSERRNRAYGLFKHSGVAWHPGDRGMAEQARLILRAMFGKVAFLKEEDGK